MPAMTTRQIQALRFIRDRISTLGQAPTLAEIGRALGVSVWGARKHVNALLRLGCLAHSRAEYRSFEVLVDPDDKEVGSSRGHLERAARALLDIVAPKLTEEALGTAADAKWPMFVTGKEMAALRSAALSAAEGLRRKRWAPAGEGTCRV